MEGDGVRRQLQATLLITKRRLFCGDWRYGDKPAMTSSSFLTFCFIAAPRHPERRMDGAEMDGCMYEEMSRYERGMMWAWQTGSERWLIEGVRAIKYGYGSLPGCFSWAPVPFTNMYNLDLYHLTTCFCFVHFMKNMSLVSSLLMPRFKFLPIFIN